jgi:hypothetical protein
MMKRNLDGRSENLLRSVLYRVYLDRGGAKQKICINTILRAALRHLKVMVGISITILSLLFHNLIGARSTNCQNCHPHFHIHSN